VCITREKETPASQPAITAYTGSRGKMRRNYEIHTKACNKSGTKTDWMWIRGKRRMRNKRERENIGDDGAIYKENELKRRKGQDDGPDKAGILRPEWRNKSPDFALSFPKQSGQCRLQRRLSDRKSHKPRHLSTKPSSNKKPHL
jgi:hypothetical protein